MAGNAAQFGRADSKVSTLGAGPGIRSGLLLGLRLDHSNEGSGSYSTYRTVYFAPQDGELQKMAEGTGLLVPYGMEFWKLDTQTLGDGSGASVLLIARRADQPFPDQPKPEVVPVVREKVLFAGNRYIALEQKVAGKTETDYPWVKELKQLQGTRNPKLIGTANEPHVSLLIAAEQQATIYSQEGPAAKDARKIENWTVARESGKWSVKEAVSNPTGAFAFDVLANVPEERIVNYDQLSVAWDKIKSVQPAARDAFSSPILDMAAIVTDRNVVVYSYAKEELGEVTLTEPLQPGEVIVMAQWATNDYVEAWKTKTQLFLSAGAN
jgi:hypothetical protein